MTTNDISKIIPVSDMTFRATYKVVEYTVTFQYKKEDGTIIEIQKSNYPYGTQLSQYNGYPSISDPEGKPCHWDITSITVTSDTIVTLVYDSLKDVTYTLIINGEGINYNALSVIINNEQVPIKNGKAEYSFSSYNPPATVNAKINGSLNQETIYELYCSTSQIEILPNNLETSLTCTSLCTVKSYNWTSDVSNIIIPKDKSVTVTTTGNSSHAVSTDITTNIYSFVGNQFSNVESALTENGIEYSITANSLSNGFDIDINFQNNYDVTKSASVNVIEKQAQYVFTFTGGSTEQYAEEVEYNETSATVGIVSTVGGTNQPFTVESLNSRCTITVNANSITLKFPESDVLQPYVYPFVLTQQDSNNKLYGYVRQNGSQGIYAFYFTEDTTKGTEYSVSAPATTTLMPNIGVTSTHSSELCTWSIVSVDGAGATASINDDKISFKLEVPENTDKTTKKYTVNLKQDGSNATIKYSLTQMSADVILLMSDYLALSYSWANDGTDLDTATYLVTPIINGKNGAVGFNTGNKSDYLEYAGDNQTSGQEKVLVKLKELKEYFNSELDGLTTDEKEQWFADHGMVKDTSLGYYAQIDMYANWFGTGSSSVNTTVSYISNSGATSYAVNTSSHDITFNGGESTGEGTGQITVNAQSFANAAAATKTEYFKKAYTKVAEVRYYVEKDITQLLTNGTSTFGNEGISVSMSISGSDGKYFYDEDLYRNYTNFYYSNYLITGTRSEYFPQTGVTTDFVLDIKINGASEDFTLTSQPDSTTVNGHEIQLQIPSTDDRTSTGIKNLKKLAGYATNYPWLKFEIGNYTSQLFADKIPNYTYSPYMWQNCLKQTDPVRINLMPNNVFYTLYDKDGSFVRSVSIYGYTGSYSSAFAVKVAEGTCSNVSLNLVSGDSSKITLPASVTNVGVFAVDMPITITANNTNNWNQWQIQATTNDSNFTDSYISTVWQRGENQLMIYTDKAHSSELTIATQLPGLETSRSFTPSQIKCIIPSDCTSEAFVLDLYFNHKVSITGTDTKLYIYDSSSTNELHLKCDSSYDAGHNNWSITVKDEEANYTVELDFTQKEK